jgi:hypothetical protein
VQLLQEPVQELPDSCEQQNKKKAATTRVMGDFC